MLINFYDNKSEKNMLEKNIEPLESVECFLKESSFSLDGGKLNISSLNLSEIGNYCFIPKFNRYYYIEDVEILKTGLYSLSLNIDVLMSFKDLIKSCSGLVVKSNTIDCYTGNYKIEDKTQNKVLTFPNSHFIEEYKLYLTGAN